MRSYTDDELTELCLCYKACCKKHARNLAILRHFGLTPNASLLSSRDELEAVNASFGVVEKRKHDRSRLNQSELHRHADSVREAIRKWESLSHESGQDFSNSAAGYLRPEIVVNVARAVRIQIKAFREAEKSTTYEDSQRNAVALAEDRIGSHRQDLLKLQELLLITPLDHKKIEKLSRKCELAVKEALFELCDVRLAAPLY